ncbi:Indoleamine 2,3-dioxygenase [Phascolomyces articulosus]|uniref:Indoleamine 2,3-dioxygenase n=1 Tax=Phascolomyces articulosus TaxID=60185 RepID=A0AAD5K1N3_9FUNG|nr:Indoleamine 2,3-dioxygenase [Phascolomyces articulosus]
MKKSLQHYDISPITGFLPTEPPLQRLQNPIFLPWEKIMDDFHELLLAGKLDKHIQKLPLLNQTRLENIKEYRRAFVVLSMLSHGYIWGKESTEKPLDILPANLAIPWCAIADYLGLYPILCYAATVLWNYKPLDLEGPLDLSNLAILSTFTGSTDEAWFYLISTAIEGVGAPCLPAMMESIRHVNTHDYDRLIDNLEIIHNLIIKITATLARMYEKCAPSMFYKKIRRYYSGWRSASGVGLPHGLIYEGVDEIYDGDSEYYQTGIESEKATYKNEQRYRQYFGASAAQSSLIAALDVFFGVDHHPCLADSNSTNDSTNNSSIPGPQPSPFCNKKKQTSKFTRTNSNAYLRAMRLHMPGPHREFLEDLEHAANLRSFMLEITNEKDQQASKNDSSLAKKIKLLQVYNDCLMQLKLFRDKHIQIVAVYIINQAHKKSNSTMMLDETRHNLPNNVIEYNKNFQSTPPSSQSSSSSTFDTKTSNGLLLHQHNNKTTKTRKVVNGSGGTDAVSFLKQARNETLSSKISNPATLHSNNNLVWEGATTVEEETPLLLPKSRYRSWLDWFTA